MATRTTKQTAQPTPPVKRNLTDDEVKQVVRELLGEGKTNLNQISKALRGTPRGTNTRRLARALQAVKEEQAKAVRKPRAPRKTTA